MGEQDKPTAIKYVKAEVVIEEVIGSFPQSQIEGVPHVNYLVVRFGDDEQKYLAISSKDSDDVTLIEVEDIDEAREEMFRHEKDKGDNQSTLSFTT